MIFRAAELRCSGISTCHYQG